MENLLSFVKVMSWCKAAQSRLHVQSKNVPKVTEKNRSGIDKVLNCVLIEFSVEKSDKVIVVYVGTECQAGIR